MTLPPKWKLIKLGEIVHSDKFAIVDGPFGTQLHAKEYTDTGIPVIRITNLTRDNKFDDQNLVFISERKFNTLKRSAIVPGDILLAKTGATIGKVALFNNYAKGLIASSCAKISINPDIANNKWVLFYLSTQRGQSQIIGGSSGSTRNSINLKQIANVKIPLPPLPTQHKIVEILEEADNLRKLRQQADEKMKDLIPSLFVQMFGDPATNPKGWPLFPISDLCKGKYGIKAGPFGSSLKKDSYTTSGYRIYGQEQVILGDFSFGDYYISKEKFESMMAYQVKSGDLLISLVGTIGKVVVVPEHIEPGIINPRLLKITPKYEIIKSVFLAELLQHHSTQYSLNNVAHGGTMGVLNAGIIKKLRVPLPPLPLQQEFAKLVEETEAEKSRQVGSKKKLDELFNNLMQRAFKGELVA